jgi:hypothetical protein
MQVTWLVLGAEQMGRREGRGGGKMGEPLHSYLCHFVMDLLGHMTPDPLCSPCTRLLVGPRHFSLHPCLALTTRDGTSWPTPGQSLMQDGLQKGQP